MLASPDGRRSIRSITSLVCNELVPPPEAELDNSVSAASARYKIPAYRLKRPKKSFPRQYPNWLILPKDPPPVGDKSSSARSLVPLIVLRNRRRGT